MHTWLLANALKLDPFLEVVPYEADPSGLVAALRVHSIHVLVVNSNLDGQPSRGLDILREMRSLGLDTRAIVLQDSSKDEDVLLAFRAGARGIFGKNERTDLLPNCVRSVHQGQIWADDQALRVVVEALADSPAMRDLNAAGVKLLSKRELEVVRGLAQGLTNREIAGRLGLSPHTIKNYLFRIFDKLGVSSRFELLFMTLGQEAAQPPVTAGAEIAEGNEWADESDLLKKAADAGLPAAQLALAQLYLNRQANPRDLVNGYMWYLIATERAWQARASITKLMTPEQIAEAKHKAATWLSKHPPAPPSAGESVLKLAPPVGERPYQRRRAGGTLDARAS